MNAVSLRDDTVQQMYTKALEFIKLLLVVWFEFEFINEATHTSRTNYYCLSSTIILF